MNQELEQFTEDQKEPTEEQKLKDWEARKAWDEHLRTQAKEEVIFEKMGLPPALIKAHWDNPFDYALKLRSGEIIRFSGCVIHQSGWVTLQFEETYGEQIKELPFSFDRGMEIRISDIVWCADAPNGS
jgi:hypothetical protein